MRARAAGAKRSIMIGTTPTALFATTPARGSTSGLAIAQNAFTTGIYHPHGAIESEAGTEAFLVASLPMLSARDGGLSQNAIVVQPIIAQNYDQDVLGDIGKGWNSFVESGQIWAMLGGLVLGYLLRSITS